MQTHFFLIATMLAGAFAVPSGPGAALAERDTNHHEVGLNSPRALPVEVEKRQVDLSSICSLLTSLGVQSASTIVRNPPPFYQFCP